MEIPHDASWGWFRASRGRGLFYSTFARTNTANIGNYLQEQVDVLMGRYDVRAFVGESAVNIPLSYVTGESFSAEVSRKFPQVYTDEVAECDVFEQGENPLALYTALQTDYAWTRFQHYTGTPITDCQRFILFTNYQMYMDEFEAYAQQAVADEGSGYTDFVRPNGGNGNGDSHRLPQMPAYHLKREDGNGITIINIGVGPSNALNMVEKVAVIRPHLVMMIGHCGGLQKTQRNGNFVIASSYARFDRILDDRLSVMVPLAPIGEAQAAIKNALQATLGLETKADLNAALQSGIVATVADRDWEAKRDLVNEVDETRACAIDMESATVAGSCLLNAIPHATLLCISDGPLDGRPKMAGEAQAFYERSKQAHLLTGIKACEALRENPNQLHSRKLRRSRSQPPLR